MWVSWLMMLLLLWSVAAARSDVKPGCQDKCGNVSVPYPFGIVEPRCAMNDDFFLNCSSGDEGHPKLWFGGNIPARNISVLEGTITASSYTPFNCYNRTAWELDKIFRTIFRYRWLSQIIVSKILEAYCHSVKCARGARFGRLAKTRPKGAGSHAISGRNRQRRFMRL